MKKYISAILRAALVFICLSACTLPVFAADSSDSGSAKEKLQIITTIFPEYDWVREILGPLSEDADITILLDNGVDLHSYQPTAEDLLNIANCDLFVYIGGESDSWTEDALKISGNPDRKVLCLMDALGDAAKEEIHLEGMEEEAEAESHEEEESEYDEHIWLSLKNAEILCEAIASELKEIDPEHGDIYQENADAYIEKLSVLDQEYAEVTDASPQKTLLFGSRFPFRYLMDDYDLTCYAAFSGCSAETEASFETILFLAEKVDELGLNHVMNIDNTDSDIARTIIQSTKNKDQDILTLNSMQSTTSADAADGATYLTIMEQNLEVLREALE